MTKFIVLILSLAIYIGAIFGLSSLTGCSKSRERPVTVFRVFHHHVDGTTTTYEAIDVYQNGPFLTVDLIGGVSVVISGDITVERFDLSK